jgi:hypothetical protein
MTLWHLDRRPKEPYSLGQAISTNENIVQRDAPAPPPGRILDAMSERAETPEPAAPAVQMEHPPTSPKAGSPTKGRSLLDRVLDAIVPFRMSHRRREYQNLHAQIIRAEADIARIERRRSTLAGPDSGLTPPEQSLIFLRSSLTADDLEVKREQVAALKGRLAQMAANYPSLTRR